MKSFFLLCALLISGSVIAHSEGTSFIDIDRDKNNISVKWQIELQDLPEFHHGPEDRFKTLDTETVSFLANKYLTLNPDKCHWQPTSFSVQNDSAGDLLKARLNSQCNSNNISIDYSALFKSNPLHKALYTLNLPVHSKQGVINFNHQQILLSANPEQTANSNYLLTGITHVLLGIDHLVFLILMLYPFLQAKGAGKDNAFYKKLIIYISCFTLAHSIILALVWFDLIPANSVLIESAIAVTILWSAIRLMLHSKPMQIWLVLFFGLIHGMGFANSVRAFNEGATGAISSLLLFNIGIELGQLCFVALLLLLAYFASQYANREQQLMYKVKPAIGLMSILVGAFWLFERSVGYYFMT